ncbi:MAG: septum formation family protein [Pseudonocardia sp.]
MTWPRTPDEEPTRHIPHGGALPPDQQPTTRVPTGRPDGGAHAAPPAAPPPYGPPPGSGGPPPGHAPGPHDPRAAAPAPGWPIAPGTAYPPGPGGAPAPPGWPAAPGGGHPPPFPPGGQPPSRGTDGFAIAALILGVLGGVLLSVIFAFVALGRIRRNGTGGRGLAIAGLVLSGLWVVGLGVVITVAVLSGADRGAGGEVVAAGDVSASDLRVGDCIVDVRETTSLLTVPVAPCTTPHQGEVVAVFDLPEGPYPAAAELNATVETRCSTEVAAYAPSAAADPALQLFYIYPLEANWSRGDRETVCIVVTDPATMGSVRGR